MSVNAGKSGFVDVAGARIYYETVGQGHPLVLVNADSLDLRMWDYQFPEFARRFKVIRYDQAGIGKTRMEGEQPSLPRDLKSHEEYLDELKVAAERQGFPTNHGDLRTLLDSLGIERAYLLGLDLGANIAIDFALDYPDRADALILASTPHVWGNEQAAEKFAAGKRLRSGSSRRTIAQMMPFVYNVFRRRDATPLIDSMMEDPSYAPTQEEARRKLRDLLIDNGEAILARRGRRFLPDFSTAGRLNEIGAPTLIMHPKGSGSPVNEIVMVRETALLLERKIPGAVKVALPGSSRLANLDQPEEFNQVVLEFLEKL